MMRDDEYPPLSPFQTGMAGKCPRCGEGALFEGYIGLKSACPSCQLDYSQADSGDGPAVFVMFITGTVAVVFAFILRFAFEMPAGIVLLAAILLTSILTGVLLRPMKGVLVALQYRNKAAEGRLE